MELRVPHWAEALASLLNAPSWMPKPVLGVVLAAWGWGWGAVACVPTAVLALPLPLLAAEARAGLGCVAEAAGVAASPGWARP